VTRTRRSLLSMLSQFTTMTCLALILTGCGPVANLRITDAHLLRTPTGHSACNVIVKVFNYGEKRSNNVEVTGHVAVRDVSNTVVEFDASDFGGVQTIEPNEEATFIGRSVVIAPGVTASYDVRVTIGSSNIDSKSSNVVTCP